MSAIKPFRSQARVLRSPDGKVVLTSGANRSIGRDTAQGLYAAGYGLSLCARDSDRFAEIIECWDETRILIHRYDAEDYETHRFWVEDDNDTVLDHMWAVNVKAPLSMIRLAELSMRLRKHR